MRMPTYLGIDGRGQSGPGGIEPESWWHRLVRLCKVDVMIVKRCEAYHIMNDGVHGRVDKTVLKLASLKNAASRKTCKTQDTFNETPSAATIV